MEGLRDKLARLNNSERSMLTKKGKDMLEFARNGLRNIENFPNLTLPVQMGELSYEQMDSSKTIGWINRLDKPQPIRAGKRKLGACAPNNDNNKHQRVDDSLIKFENMIREENTKFNRNSPKFRESDQTIKIKAVNVNSIISFHKRNKVSDLLNDDPDILAIVDTRVKAHKIFRFRNKTRNTLATNTDQRGVAIIAKRSLNPEFFTRDE